MSALDKYSLRLSALNDALINDNVFADAAMQLLLTEDPTSTYTRASAGMALINHLMIEHAITCYNRDLVIDAASGLVLPDDDGDYGDSITAITHSRYIDTKELAEQLNILGLALPVIMQGLTIQTHPQADAIDGDKPWLLHNPKDPNPLHHWYTPARYFARELIKKDPLLLVKRLLLAEKVRGSLANYSIFKRGEKKPPQSDTILKAFSNVDFR